MAQNRESTSTESAQFCKQSSKRMGQVYPWNTYPNNHYIKANSKQNGAAQVRMLVTGFCWLDSESEEERSSKSIEQLCSISLPRLPGNWPSCPVPLKSLRQNSGVDGLCRAQASTCRYSSSLSRLTSVSSNGPMRSTVASGDVLRLAFLLLDDFFVFFLTQVPDFTIINRSMIKCCNVIISDKMAHS